MSKTCAIYPKITGAIRRHLSQSSDNDLNDFFGSLTDDAIYRAIEVFNYRLRKNKAASIHDNDMYNGEQILNIANNIKTLITNKQDAVSKIIAERREELRKVYGDITSVARDNVFDRLTAKELSEVQSDVVTFFLDTALSKARATNKSGLYEYIQSLDNRELSELFNAVVNRITDEARNNYDYYFNAGDYDTAESINSLRGKVIGEFFGDGILNDVIVLTIPMINNMFGLNINSDIKLSRASESVSLSDDETNLEDVEMPTPEGWQIDPDTESPTANMAASIHLEMALLPKVERVSTVRYFDKDGKELSDNEIDEITVNDEDSEDDVKRKEKLIRERKIRISYSTEYEPVVSTLTGYKLLSDPNSMARRIGSMLIGCSSGNEMIERLSKDDRYNDLVTKLKEKPIFRNTFVSFFNKYQQETIGTTTKRTTSGLNEYSTPTLNVISKDETADLFVKRLKLRGAPSYSIFRTVLNSGSKSNSVAFNPANLYNFMIEFNGVTSDDGKIITGGIKEAISYYLINGTFDPNSGITSYNALRAAISLIFDSFAIETSDETINAIATNKSDLSVLIDSVSKAMPQLQNTDVNQIRNDFIIKNGFVNLIRLAGSNDISGRSTNMFTFAGKRQSSRILPSSVTAEMKKLHSLSDEEAIKYINDKFLESELYKSKTEKEEDSVIYNGILRDLVLSKQSSSINPSLRSVFDIVRNMGINSTEAEKTNRREHILMDIMTYLNHLNLYGRDNYTEKDEVYADDNGTTVYRNSYAYIPSFITGDNNSSRYYKLYHHTEDEIKNGIYNLYLSELNIRRMQEDFQKRGFMFKANNKEAFTKVGLNQRYGLLPFLNNIKENVGDYNNPMVKDEFIKNVLNPYLKQAFVDFRSFLESEGVLDTDEKGRYIYFAKQLGDNRIANNDKKVADKNLSNTEMLDSMLYDYYLNYLYGSYNIMNLNQVSTLFFNGVEDVQKRNKGTLTNGYQVMVDALDMDGNPLFSIMDGEHEVNQSVVYFEDIILGTSQKERDAIWNMSYKHYSRNHTDSEAKALADEFTATYDKNTITDGEAYRSLDSYRRILMSIGEPFWNRRHQEAYENIQKIIQKVKDNPDAELDINEMAEVERNLLVMQPIKPINDGIETYGAGNVKIPFQLKYAEVPIVPEMYPKGSKLREMGMWMQRNGVDLMASTKCGKKGVFGMADIQYVMQNGMYVNKDGNIIDGINSNGEPVKGSDRPTMGEQLRYINTLKEDPRVPYDDNTSFDKIMDNNTDMSATPYDGKDRNFIIHRIPLSTMLIQSNVPDHSNGQSILGTQGRKIVDAAIKFDVDYDINGKKISGKDFKSMYNSLHSAKYAKSFEQFMRLMADTGRLSCNLVYSIMSSGRVNPSIIEKLGFDDNGMPIISFAEPSMRGDLESMLISMYKRYVIRQTIDGGNVVQASSLGVGRRWVGSQDLQAITKKDSDGNDIIVGVECEMPFDFSYTETDGTTVKLKYEDWCNPDGTFKVDNNGNTLIEKRFPGILDLVGYRIPTEKEYSMFYMHIKRVTPKGCANSIKLPSWCTTRAGFDFDIDKLFLIRHNYSFQEANNDNVNKAVWDKIYEKYPGVYDTLLLARASMTDEEKQRLADKVGVENIKDIRLHQYWYESNLFLSEKKKSEYYNECYKEIYNELLELRGPSFGFDKTGGELLDMSVQDINNALVDMYISALSDVTTAMDSMEQGGFDGASEAARTIRIVSNLSALQNEKAVSDMGDFNTEDGEAIDMDKVDSLVKSNKKLDYKPEYDYAQPQTAVIFKEQNQAAGNLIGIFANDNVNSFISTKLSTLEFGKKYRVLFGSLANPADIKEINGEYENLDTSKVGLTLLNSSTNGIAALKQLAQMLAASVDAVKDPVLNYLNLNTITADSAGMLLRMGYSILDVGLLLNQPVIRKTCDYMRYNGITNITTALKAVIRDNYGAAAGNNVNQFLKGSYDSSKLTQGILAKNLSVEDVDVQLNIAKIFDIITRNSKELSGFIQSTRNTSANVVKSRFGDAIASSNRGTERKRLIVGYNNNVADPITDYWSYDATKWDENGNVNKLHNQLKGFIEKYKDHPFEYENMVHNLTSYSIDFLMRKFTPYETKTYVSLRETLANMITPWAFNGDVVESLNKAIPMLRLATMPTKFNPNVVVDGVKNSQRYIVDFMKQIQMLLTGEWNNQMWYCTSDEEVEEMLDYFANNPILARLDSEPINGNSEAQEVLKFDYSGYISQQEKMELTGAFNDLCMKYPKFAEDLFMHFYYTRGLDASKNKILDLVPSNLIKDFVIDENGTEYLDMFSGKDDNINSDELDVNKTYDLLYRFMMMNRNNVNIVPKMPFHRSDATGSNRDTEILTISGINKDACTIRKTRKGAVMMPLINVDGTIYALQNNGSTFGDGLTTNFVAGEPLSVRYKIVTSEVADENYNIVGSNNAYIFGEYSLLSNLSEDEKVDDSTDSSIGTEETDDSESGNTPSDAARQAIDDANNNNNQIVDAEGNIMCPKTK